MIEQQLQQQARVKLRPCSGLQSSSSKPLAALRRSCAPPDAVRLWIGVSPCVERRHEAAIYISCGTCG